VDFKVEYRLFIGNHQLYGIGFQKGDKNISNYNDFIKQILEISDGFYAIDIGYDNDWSIVEINPPFSLDDYGISMHNYVRYAIDFYKKSIEE